MLAILSKLIPFRDYVYAAVAIAAIGYYNIHVHDLEVGYAKQKTDAVYAAIDATQKAAKAAADAKEKQYAVAASQVEDNYETQLQAADAQHSSDLERVRQLAAQINRGSVPAGASGAAAPADAGSVSAAALGSAAELADALRHDDDQLQKCWDERSLVGK